MSTFFCVDAKGDRILTDILVAGFVHEGSMNHKLTIPNEMIGIIFMYWLITVCDEWDDSISHESVNIDGPFAHFTKSKPFSVFGKKSIETGIFEWKLRLKTRIDWCCIGLIKDEMEVLKSNQTKNDSPLRGDGTCLFNEGILFTHGIKSNIGYCNKFTKEGTVIIVTLDMDSKTIKFKIDDNEYDSKPIGLSINKYRLIVTMNRRNTQIELL